MNGNDGYSTIIDVHSLAELMNEPAAEHPLVIVDSRFSLADTSYGLTQYQQSHLPGAFFADLDKDLSRPPVAGQGRHPLPDPADFEQLLSRFGITPQTQVVVYDDAAGGVAGRFWWMLRHWVGHHRVALLDGDFRAWTAAELPVTDVVPASAPSQYRLKTNDAAIATVAEVASISVSQVPDLHAVVDARAAKRFRGEEEPVDPVAGHIPGSLNLPLSENLGKDGRFLSAATLHARFSELGGQQPDRVIHSCGSGVSACHNLLAMDIAGLTGSRLYVGSWSEWITDSTRQVSTGEV